MLPVLKVVDVTLDGDTCTIPADALLDTIGDDEENTYTVRFHTMTQNDYEALPEFNGW